MEKITVKEKELLLLKKIIIAKKTDAKLNH